MADASTGSSWLGLVSSITSAASYKTNPTTTSGALATGGQKELKTTIESDDNEQKQVTSNVVAEKTSDHEEQEDDDRWEDGGWGEEVRTTDFCILFDCFYFQMCDIILYCEC